MKVKIKRGSLLLPLIAGYIINKLVNISSFPSHFGDIIVLEILLQFIVCPSGWPKLFLPTFFPWQRIELLFKN
jgi:hypothetical protein